MTACERADLLIGLLDDHDDHEGGALTPAERAEALAHVATCAACREALDAYREVERTLRQAPVEAPSEQATARAFAAMIETMDEARGGEPALRVLAGGRSLAARRDEESAPARAAGGGAGPPGPLRRPGVWLQGLAAAACLLIVASLALAPRERPTAAMARLPDAPAQTAPSPPSTPAPAAGVPQVAPPSAPLPDAPHGADVPRETPQSATPRAPATSSELMNQALGEGRGRAGDAGDRAPGTGGAASAGEELEDAEDELDAARRAEPRPQPTEPPAQPDPSPAQRSDVRPSGGAPPTPARPASPPEGGEATRSSGRGGRAGPTTSSPPERPAPTPPSPPGAGAPPAPPEAAVASAGEVQVIAAWRVGERVVALRRARPADLQVEAYYASLDPAVVERGRARGEDGPGESRGDRGGWAERAREDEPVTLVPTDALRAPPEARSMDGFAQREQARDPGLPLDLRTILAAELHEPRGAAWRERVTALLLALGERDVAGLETRALVDRARRALEPPTAEPTPTPR